MLRRILVVDDADVNREKLRGLHRSFGLSDAGDPK